MNSIIGNNQEGNNTMNSSLNFIWIALFKDNSKIEQFENGIEHRFKEIQDKLSELAYFNLTNSQGKMFSVDLINGRIGYNDLILPYREENKNKENIRLIFFRRHRIEISEIDLKEKSHIIEYHLGFQYNRAEKNRQIVLIIDNEGNFVIEVE